MRARELKFTEHRVHWSVCWLYLVRSHTWAHSALAKSFSIDFSRGMREQHACSCNDHLHVAHVIFRKIFLVSPKLLERSFPTVQKTLKSKHYSQSYGVHKNDKKLWFSWTFMKKFKLNEFASWWGRVNFRCGKNAWTQQFSIPRNFFVYWSFPTFFGPLESYVSRDLYFTKSMFKNSCRMRLCFHERS